MDPDGDSFVIDDEAGFKCTKCRQLSQTSQNILLSCSICSKMIHENCHNPKLKIKQEKIASWKCKDCFYEERLSITKDKNKRKKSNKVTKPGKPVHLYNIDKILDHVVCSQKINGKTVPKYYRGSKLLYLVQWSDTKDDNDEPKRWSNTLIPDIDINARHLIFKYRKQIKEECLVLNVKFPQEINFKELKCKHEHCKKCKYCEIKKVGLIRKPKKQGLDGKITKVIFQRQYRKQHDFKNGVKYILNDRCLTKKQQKDKKIGFIKSLPLTTKHKSYGRLNYNNESSYAFYRGNDDTLNTIKLFNPNQFNEAERKFDDDGNVTKCFETAFCHLFNETLDTKEIITRSDLPEFVRKVGKDLLELKSFNRLHRDRVRQRIKKRIDSSDYEKLIMIKDNDIFKLQKGVYIILTSNDNSNGEGHVYIYNAYNSFLYDGGSHVYTLPRKSLDTISIFSDLSIRQINAVFLVLDTTYKSSVDDLNKYNFIYYEITGTNEAIGHPIFTNFVQRSFKCNLCDVAVATGIRLDDHFRGKTHRRKFTQRKLSSEHDYIPSVFY